MLDDRRQQLALGVIAVAACIGLRGVLLIGDYFKGDTEDVVLWERYEDRFASVNRTLPEDALLGYVSDRDDADFDRIGELLMARYVLAPRRVVDTTKTEFVLANLTTGERHRLPEEFRLVTDFGAGVQLWQRKQIVAGEE